MATKSIKAPRGFHWMKKGGKYTLMKGSYKPHTGAVKKLNLDYKKEMRKRKKLTAKQKKIAKPKKRIDAADFRKLRRRKKRR